MGSEAWCEKVSPSPAPTDLVYPTPRQPHQRGHRGPHTAQMDRPRSREWSRRAVGHRHLPSSFALFSSVTLVLGGLLQSRQFLRPTALTQQKEPVSPRDQTPALHFSLQGQWRSGSITFIRWLSALEPHVLGCKLETNVSEPMSVAACPQIQFQALPLALSQGGGRCVVLKRQ